VRVPPLPVPSANIELAVCSTHPSKLPITQRCTRPSLPTHCAAPHPPGCVCCSMVIVTSQKLTMR
jgi:hypothetical protein